jgi:hypothetical protein
LPLLNKLHQCQVYVSHIYHVIENSCLCTIYNSSASRGFAKQIMSILCILCYNGSLVTWTVVSLTVAKFKLLIFSMYEFSVLKQAVYTYTNHQTSTPARAISLRFRITGFLDFVHRPVFQKTVSS